MTNNDLQHYNFGPLLSKTKLVSKFVNYFYEIGQTMVKNDMQKNLAGHIQKEYYFNNEHKQIFLEGTWKIFENYVEEVTKRRGTANNGETIPIPNIRLENLWINFMEAGEFNPIHTHSGDISFVIYCKVPEGIKEEVKNFKGRHGGPGTIDFVYGQPSHPIRLDWISNYNFLPEKNDFYIFPAWLSHTVAPYKTKEQRVSISGNIDFIE